jgi:hypothetical protein
VGTLSPLQNNSVMWSGKSNLTTTGSGNGTFKTPGTVTSFEYDTTSSSVTNANGSVTTTTVKYYVDVTYRINYDAIIYWLQNTGPNPFPSQLRAGGILYYSSIPSSIDTYVHPAIPGTTTPTFPLPTGTQGQKDVRFWKEYIDEMLGLQQGGHGSWTNSGTTVKYATYSYIGNMTGYVDEFAWNGTSAATGIWPSVAGLTSYITSSGNATAQNVINDTRYMDYRDNPKRPSLQFWFGPMTMVDFIGNMNMNRYWMPGTAHEAPTWQCKAGVQAAIGDIKVNHPNDYISLIAFSTPVGYTPTLPGVLQAGAYNAVRSPLAQNYTQIVNSLYFAPEMMPPIVTQNTEISPYDAAITDVPRAFGGTCAAMGLMLAYNQFAQGASDSTLRSYSTTGPNGQAGGLGRKGAQKLVIFETDGVCSATAYQPGQMTSVFTNSGPYNSYYNVRWDTTGSVKNEYPPYLSGDTTNAPLEAIEVATRVCSSDTSTSAPGFSTARKPVRIYCLAFGSLFNTPYSSNAQTALNMLQQIQYVGGTQSDPTTVLPASQVINGGTSASRISTLQTAFSNIMQDGYSVTLIK